MTKRERIVLAIMATLSGTPAGLNVFRSLTDALDEAVSPAIVVQWTDDEPRQYLVNFTERDLTVKIDIITRGAIPDSLADPVIESVHSKIMADVSLGGIAFDITEGSSSNEIEGSNIDAGILTARYVIQYRTAVNDLSA